MKISYLYWFILLLFSACNSGAEKNSSTEASKQSPVTSDLSDWGTCWAGFQNAVALNDAEKIATFCHFPLKGFYPWTTAKNGLTKEDFLNSQWQIFDEVARSVIIGTNASDVLNFEITTDEQAAGFELPTGIKLKHLQVNYSYEKENGDVKLSTNVFYFAQIDGQYGLYAIVFE